MANDKTVFEDKRNSKNNTNIDDTNVTKSDIKNDNITIGEILNDSELKPLNISRKLIKKKPKFSEKNIIPEETLANEPSKEVLDRLI